MASMDSHSGEVVGEGGGNIMSFFLIKKSSKFK